MSRKDLTQEEIKNLAKLYLAARERLLDTIINYKGVGTRTYANTVLRRLQKELAELQKQTAEFIGVAIPREYRKELRETYKYFTRNHLRMKNPSAFASLHTDALYEISREMQYQVQEGLAIVGRQVTRYVGTALDEALRQEGLIQAGVKAASGGTVQDMRAALLKELQDKGFMTVQYGDDARARQVPLDVYTSMVARSTSREAGNTARLNQLSLNGYDLVQMSTHYPTCAVCAALQGRVYSISGKDKRFPPLAKAFGEYNNVHPNCRHVIVPFIESLKTPEEMEEAQRFSNQPFVDSRPAKEIALYKAQQDKARRARNTVYQYERYRQVLGEESPRFMTFKRLKKEGGEEWKTLQAKYRKASRMQRKNGIIHIKIDGFTPCLKDTQTGEILETEVARIEDKNYLKPFNEKSGWFINWSEMPKESEVYGLYLRGDNQVQGLISIKNDAANAAVYGNWMVAAPHNRGQDKRYSGVGGHLYAIAGQRSIAYGHGGFFFGRAANLKLLEHYVETFGAQVINYGDYTFQIDEFAMAELLAKYAFDWRG